LFQNESDNDADDENYDPRKEAKRRRKDGGANRVARQGRGKLPDRYSGMAVTKNRAKSTGPLGAGSQSTSASMIVTGTTTTVAPSVSTAQPAPASAPLRSTPPAPASTPPRSTSVSSATTTVAPSVLTTPPAPASAPPRSASVSSATTTVTQPVSTAPPALASAPTVSARVTTADIMAVLARLDQKLNLLMNEVTKLTADNVAIRHDLVVCT